MSNLCSFVEAATGKIRMKDPKILSLLDLAGEGKYRKGGLYSTRTIDVLLPVIEIEREGVGGQSERSKCYFCNKVGTSTTANTAADSHFDASLGDLAINQDQTQIPSKSKSKKGKRQT